MPRVITLESGIFDAGPSLATSDVLIGPTLDFPTTGCCELDTDGISDLLLI